MGFIWKPKNMNQTDNLRALKIIWGHYTTNPNNAHAGNPSKSPYICTSLIPSQNASFNDTCQILGCFKVTSLGFTQKKSPWRAHLGAPWDGLGMDPASAIEMEDDMIESWWKILGLDTMGTKSNFLRIQNLVSKDRMSKYLKLEDFRGRILWKITVWCWGKIHWIWSEIFCARLGA